MKRKSKLIATSLALVVVGAPLALAGCDTLTGNNPLGTLCCTDFKPGSAMISVDWGFKDANSNAQFGGILQAIGDFSATAQSMVTDLGVACKGLALDLGSDEAALNITTKTKPNPNDYTAAWCGEAVKQITDLRANASISIVVQPPKCDVSVKAKLDCEGQCDASVDCQFTPGEIVANCEPGKVSGQCSATCTGKCEGSANLAVQCDGTCHGTCEGNCKGGTQNGGQCSGECQGTCRGTCDLMAGANVQCDGQCTGSCSAEFTAPKCTGKFTPPMGKCEANASCQASCDASASAKAECTPPSVDIEIMAGTNVEAKVNALKKWLPEMLLIVQAKIEALGTDAAALGDLDTDLDVTASAKATLCLVPALAAVVDAGTNLTATGSLSGSITGAIQ